MAEVFPTSRKGQAYITLLDRLTKPAALAKDLERRERRTEETRSMVDDFLQEVRQNIQDLQKNRLYGNKGKVMLD